MNNTALEAENMKLILKENPNQELTVTVEYPKQGSKVSRIIQKLRTEEQFKMLALSKKSHCAFMDNAIIINV